MYLKVYDCNRSKYSGGLCFFQNVYHTYQTFLFFLFLYSAGRPMLVRSFTNWSFWTFLSLWESHCSSSFLESKLIYVYFFTPQPSKGMLLFSPMALAR